MSTAGAVMVWLMALVNGAVIGLFVGYLVWGRRNTAAAVPETPAPVAQTEEDLERIRKEREDLIASQKAFQTMMGYNADIAYGINSEEDFTAGGS